MLCVTMQAAGFFYVSFTQRINFTGSRRIEPEHIIIFLEILKIYGKIDYRLG
jgi:hypothetical protein